MGVVQAQHAIQPVEQAAQLDDVVGLHRLVMQLFQQPLQPADLLFDLRRGAAQRRCGAGAEGTGHQEHQELLVGPFVG